ncbi:hypothetical protein [Rubritalea sp.]|uniref:hypothetical protein n=1 Tax=Rubritalea sp. TaxID=2109375 RepID=UPI003EF933C1
MPFISNIKDFAMRKGYTLLRKKGASCPECGEALDLPEQIPEGDDMLHCSGCNWSGGVFDLVTSADDWGNIQSQPVGSKIIKSETAEGLRWLMPASKRPNFLFFFALIWLGFISFFTFMVVFGSAESEEAGWAVGLFLVPFWAVGGGVAYWGLRMMLMESILLVNAEEVQLMQKLFGKVKLKKVLRSEVKQVERYTAYKQNDRPVYGVRIKTSGKEKIDFGSRLKDEEKRWLVSELSDVLEPKLEINKKSVGSEAAYGGAMKLVSYDELDEIQEKGLKLKRVGDKGFRIEREHQSGKWFLIGGLIGICVSVFLFSQAIDSFDLGDDFGFMELIDIVFSAVPLIIGLAFGALGLGSLWAAGHFIGLVEKFEFSPDELLVKKGKKGQLGKKVSYTKDTFHSSLKRNLGEVNNDSRYSVSLKGRSKRAAIVGFVKEELADSLVSWLDAWLGH